MTVSPSAVLQLRCPFYSPLSGHHGYTSAGQALSLALFSLLEFSTSLIQSMLHVEVTWLPVRRALTERLCACVSVLPTQGHPHVQRQRSESACCGSAVDAVYTKLRSTWREEVAAVLPQHQGKIYCCAGNCRHFNTVYKPPRSLIDALDF